MPSRHHRFFGVSMTPLAISLSLVSQAVERPHSAANIPAATGERNENLDLVLMEIEAVTAWTSLQAADAEIPAMIDQGQFADVSRQSEIIKSAATIIGQKTRLSDKQIKPLLDSLVRQVVALADRLHDAAASGKPRRVTTAYQNLHRYVEWAQAHLPPVPASRPGAHIAG